MPTKLYTEEEHRDGVQARDIFMDMIVDLMRQYKYQDEGRHRKECESGSTMEKNRYPFIPADPGTVMSQLQFVRNYCRGHHILSPSFIDAGAGIGWVVRIAHRLEFCAYGAELNEENIKVAMQLFTTNIWRKDIMDIDYSKFDVIYYYCPIQKDEMQVQFEQKVEKEMRAGAIVIANLKRDHTICKDKRFVNIWEGHPVWQKKGRCKK